jgi:hypothetical protein
MKKNQKNMNKNQNMKNNQKNMKNNQKNMKNNQKNVKNNQKNMKKFIILQVLITFVCTFYLTDRPVSPALLFWSF